METRESDETPNIGATNLHGYFKELERDDTTSVLTYSVQLVTNKVCN